MDAHNDNRIFALGNILVSAVCLCLAAAPVKADFDICEGLVGMCFHLPDLQPGGRHYSPDQFIANPIINAMQKNNIDPNNVYVTINDYQVDIDDPSLLRIKQQYLAPVSLSVDDDGTQTFVVTITETQLLQLGWHLMNAAPDEPFPQMPWLEWNQMRTLALEWERVMHAGGYPEDIQKFDDDMPEDYAFLHAFFRGRGGRNIAPFQTAWVLDVTRCMGDAQQLLEEVISLSLANANEPADFETLLDTNADDLRSVVPECLRGV